MPHYEFNVPPVSFSAYYRIHVRFGPAEAPTLRANVSQLIESSKITFAAIVYLGVARSASHNASSH